jgi:prepilin-type N-terminal cleavage/methylation domain-containing protein
MKTTIQLPERLVPARRRGMTLPEMMIAFTVFSLVVVGMVYTQMFVMRYDQLTSSKLGATEMTRMSFDQLLSDVRSCRTWAIGTGNVSSFTAAVNGTNLVGNALIVYPSVNTNNYVLYYFTSITNPGIPGFPLTNIISMSLCRMTNGGSNYVTTPVKYLTNTMYFCAENYAGTVQQTLTYKYIIHVKMDFCQYQYPLTYVGPGYYYDSYPVDLRVTSHNQ